MILTLKIRYKQALTQRKAILSYCNRVNALAISVCAGYCDNCDYYAFSCFNHGTCAMTWKKVNRVINLTSHFEDALASINWKIKHLQEKLIARYAVKRIAKLNKKARKNNPLGSWIHIFNQRVSNWTEYINDFSKIQGEVCVSRESDMQYTKRNNFVGVKIEGQLTAQWSFDCWSKVLVNGKRFGTKNGGSHRHEGWIIPANAKITAIVCSRPTKQIIRISRELNLDIEVIDNTRNW